MKSKEIAALLVSTAKETFESARVSPGDAPDRDVTHALVTQSVQQCLQLLREAASSTNGKAGKMSDEALASRLREAFTKWKAVVRNVRKAYPTHPIAEHMLPSLIAAQSPATYEALKKMNTFLGYEPSSFEKEVQLENMLQNAMKSALAQILF
jgi:hypothetical protein